MKFRIRHADRIVGLFILVALALVAAMLIFIAINQRWFSHNANYVSKLKSATGLTVGTDITMRGFKLGKISDMSLSKDTDNLVEIKFYVYEKYIDKVTENSVLELSTSPIGLGTSLEFHSGKSRAHLKEGSLVPSLGLPEGLALERAGLVDRPQGDSPITTALASVNELLLLINDTLKGRGSGPINDTLLSIKKGANSFPATMANVNLISDDLKNGLANLPTVMNQIEAATANLQVLTEKIRDPDSLIPTLLGTKDLPQQIEQTMQQLHKAMDDVTKITSGIAGEVPKLSSLLMETRAAISSAQDVMEGLKNNPLLKDGITKKPSQQAVYESLRREDF